MKIRAAVARAPHALMSFETLDLEDPRDDEILVRLVATGVCHTDMAMRDQTFPVPQPIVLGHEGSGVVDAVGRAVRKVRRGDHVVMTYDSCGRCPSCYAGKTSYCHEFFACNFTGSRSDGSTALRKEAEPIHSHFFGQSSFATYAICHERNIVPVGEAVPLEILGPLACGIQTGAGAVFNSLRVGAGNSLIIFGTGSVGLSAVMAARLTGATQIIAVDLIAERLALALELGATHTVNPREADVAEVIAQIAPQGVDVALETTGSPNVIKSAVSSLAPRGVCGLLGATEVSVDVALNVAHLMTAGRTVRGIIEGDSTPDMFIPALIQLYRQGRFPFDRLIRFYPFEQLDEAIHDSESGRTIKAVVRMP
jgi:aryl-alcohol dehydrogenase